MRGIVHQLAAVLAASGTAEAAPWVREPGGWYARTLAASQRLDGAEGWQSDVYIERALSSRVTLTAKAEAVLFPDAPAFDREAYRLTLRRRMYSSGVWTAGIEAGLSYGATTIGVFGCDSAGGEVRAGIGRSGLRDGRPFHQFADIAHIVQEDGCTRTRLEIGYGSDMTRRIFVSQQLWAEVGDRTAQSVKLESQVGVHLGRMDLSLGYREEFGGRFDERAVLVAVVMQR